MICPVHKLERRSVIVVGPEKTIDDSNGALVKMAYHIFQCEYIHHPNCRSVLKKGQTYLTSEGQVLLRQWALDFTRQFCVEVTPLRNEFVLGRGALNVPFCCTLRPLYKVCQI